MSDTLRVLPLILVSAVAASVATVWIFQPAPVEADSEATVSALRQAGQERDELRSRLAELERAQAVAPAAGAARAPVLDDAAVQRAVELWLERNGAGLAAAAGGAAGALEGSAGAGEAELPPFENADQAFAALLEGGLDFDSRSELWQRIRDAGLTDAVLEALEEYAEDNPADPALQLVLGEAYLNKVFEVGNTPQAGAWAMKADTAFDRALEADPGHWEARFTKAVSLSNWPAFLGKQNEAINQFEMLVDQQGSSAANPSYADTYLILGNLYQQTGRAEDALRVWRQGAGLFPDRQDLFDQIAAID